MYIVFSLQNYKKITTYANKPHFFERFLQLFYIFKNDFALRCCIFKNDHIGNPLCQRSLFNHPNGWLFLFNYANTLALGCFAFIYLLFSIHFFTISNFLYPSLNVGSRIAPSPHSFQALIYTYCLLAA